MANSGYFPFGVKNDIKIVFFAISIYQLKNYLNLFTSIITITNLVFLILYVLQGDILHLSITCESNMDHIGAIFYFQGGSKKECDFSLSIDAMKENVLFDIATLLACVNT